MKSTRIYLIYFQASAGRPQVGDRILCKPEVARRAKAALDAGFVPLQNGIAGCGGIFARVSGCENLADALSGKGSGKPRSHHQTQERASEIAALRRLGAELQRA